MSITYLDSPQATTQSSPQAPSQDSPKITYLDNQPDSVMNNMNQGQNPLQALLTQATQHPFKTNFQSGIQSVTGQSAEQMAGQAVQNSNIGQSNQKPYDQNLWQVQPTAMGANIAGQALDAATTPATYEGGALLKGIVKVAPKAIGAVGNALGDNFKAYNDATVSNAVKSSVSKIQGALKPLRDAYKTINAPFANQMVDSQTFNKILSRFPDSIKNDLVEDYGTGIVDQAGKPMTTNGKLYNLEMNLKSLVTQPKYGQKLMGDNFDTAQLAQDIKNIRLSTLPQGTQDAIRALDKKFAPAIKMEREYLPKMMDNNGVPKTEFLYQAFKNPAKAGIRDDMRNLTKNGVDLTPEIRTFEGWVRRQGFKTQIKSATGKAIEGAALGSILKIPTGG